MADERPDERLLEDVETVDAVRGGDARQRQDARVQRGHVDTSFPVSCDRSTPRTGPRLAELTG
jgi:hypothetical protein